MRKPALLVAAVAAIAAAPAFAQTAQHQQQPGAPPLSGTGRTERSAEISGTAGSRAEVVTAAEFVRAAASSDLFETQAGRLALERSQNQRVRSFAQEMVQDHQKTTEALRALLAQHATLRGTAPPATAIRRANETPEAFRSSIGTPVITTGSPPGTHRPASAAPVRRACHEWRRFDRAVSIAPCDSRSGRPSGSVYFGLSKKTYALYSPISK